jgi:hypothetical protein
MNNSDNKHGQYRRPEIVRNNDLLAQDQRKTLELQKKRIDYAQRLNHSNFIGLINGKVYSNVQSNSDYCNNLCVKENKKLSESLLVSPLHNNRSLEKEENLEIDKKCLENCMMKKGESFRLLMNVKFLKIILFLFFWNFSTFLKK